MYTEISGIVQKKPIYDDLTTEADKKTPPPPAAAPPGPEGPSDAEAEPSSPTPTDLLAGQIRQARLFLYSHALTAENGLNDFISRVLHIENAFTKTVASLAPSPESGEQLLPGSAYAVVAAMAGTIVSRNRGIFLRAVTPIAFGTAAAWYLLPATMRNVSDFAWTYEEKVPAIAEQHLKFRDEAEHVWTTGVAHSQMARSMMEEKIGDARKRLEELISKGL